MTVDHLYDVIVVGAGPAGVASAIVARQAGLRVGVLDDPDDDALKVGESLPGSVLRTLHRLAIAGPSELLQPDEAMPCAANVSAWGSDTWTFNDAIASPEGGGWHVLRHRFDAALRDRVAALGVERIHASVRDVEQADGLHRVHMSAGTEPRPRHLDARFLIDATGRRAFIFRRLGLKRRRLSEQCAAVAWLRHPAHDVDTTTRVKAVRNGWWYTARLPQGLRVIAFHGLPQDVAQLMKGPERLAEACNATDLLPYRVQSDDVVRPLKAVDASVQVGEPVGGPGWLAVGDAALSFDPLSSQGVLFALYSGIRGTEAALRCLAQPERTRQSLDEYQRKVNDVLAANQRARMGFYWGEGRYAEQPYWQAQRRGLAAAAGEGARQAAAGSPS